MKRFISTGLVIILSIIFACSLASANTSVVLRLEQYYADMPNIDVYFYPLDSDGNSVKGFMFEKSDVEAYLDDTMLIVESVELESDAPIVYVVLLDISKSVGTQFFDNIKEVLIDWHNTLSSEDSLILITMGGSVDVILDGSESIESAKPIIEGIKQEGSEQSTKYYEALNKAIDKAERLSVGTRCVVTAISDGKNSADSAYNRNDTLNRLKDAKLPLYTLGIGRNDNAVQLQDLSLFAEAASGTYMEVSTEDKNSITIVSNTFNELINQIKGCCRIRLNTGSNSVTGDTLRIKVSTDDIDVTLTIPNFRIDSWQPDSIAPYIESVTIDTPYTVSVKFSEPVEGADTVSNYSIMSADSTPVGIESVLYDQSSNIAVITLKNQLYDGEYSITCANITDKSKEKNELVMQYGEHEVIIQEQNPMPTAAPTEEPPEPQKEKSWFSSYGVFILIAIAVLVLLVVILIIVASRKKHRNNQEDEPNADSYNQLQQPQAIPGTAIGVSQIKLSHIGGRNVELSVIEKNGICRNVTLFVSDSCIIGRSEGVCDMVIEDSRLSRQHCALSHANDCILIHDLNSTNGTIVNGMPVREQRRLYPNDRIDIGNTKIVVKSC